MTKLGFIGGGNMAEALARGLLAKHLYRSPEIVVSDVAVGRRRRLARSLHVAMTADNGTVAREAPVIVLAVKPQTIDTVLGEIGSVLREAASKRLFISIAAGIPIARIERPLGAGARVIRVMPNAAAMVGEGMAALVRGKNATREDIALALRIFRAVGDAIELANEASLDAVTALSGSGPAYVFLFVKSLVQGAVAEGLSPALALRMAIQTIRGAERQIRETKLTLDEMIRIVASPGGTTEAALRRFAESRFSDIVADALRAAAARSRELGRGNR
jgi:pyrroline-5-carboxylate reductase